MEGEDCGNLSNEKIFQIFSSFMARITKFEELVDAGNKYLIGFQQGLEFIQRPPIDMTAELIERIVTANKTTRLSSYVEAGCFNSHDRKQNMSKLSACHLGLLDNLNRAQTVVRELQCLLDDAAVLVQAKNMIFQDLLHFQDNDTDLDVSSFTTACKRNPGITDYAVLMALMYGMLKKDYEMQEKIVSSLSLKSSSGELESYCLMWSLRPFVDDEIMQKAWELIP
ncbi:hypothetical protein M9H77_04799 [Catharanthus roseus]|uniref:Uncharacterized protein n=1 Tax=Catharanthus roseus TaxID=4058 RepID=A0ACC0CF46_CATRO|nr:hypothetical protein M9H77_04799 [Catharanthus roseus]